jgi:hypothetical protein
VSEKVARAGMVGRAKAESGRWTSQWGGWGGWGGFWGESAREKDRLLEVCASESSDRQWEEVTGRG